uniref:Uncharacterized protein n=1 Tax=Siphoviridae sp. ctKvA22 TaxID=2826246 RepID=A0A8S5MAB0_9CAUD|nr:MAG TPA: hypothetical protein [Siphoviridae sp. ctKvA22]
MMQPPLTKVLYHKTALFAIHFYKQKEVFFYDYRSCLCPRFYG